MTEKLQRIKCYYKSELADLYEINQRIFMTWLDKITKKLKETGYKKSQKILTQKQVEIIFEHLGHPPAIKNEIHIEQRVTIIPYDKIKLAKLYDITPRTLLTQIHSIPVEEDLRIIMNRDKSPSWNKKKYKSFFNKNAVSLIFKHLGHPYAKA